MRGGNEDLSRFNFILPMEGGLVIRTVASDLIARFAEEQAILA